MQRVDKLEQENQALKSENAELKAQGEELKAQGDYLKSEDARPAQGKRSSSPPMRTRCKGADWASKVTLSRATSAIATRRSATTPR